MGKKLQFTDYKKAHTETTFTNTKTNRKKYSNIGDLKIERRQVQYTMSQEQMRQEALQRKREKEMEKERILRIHDRDGSINRQFNRINNVIKGAPIDKRGVGNHYLSITEY